MSAGQVREAAEWVKAVLTFAVAPLLPQEERKAWPWQELARNPTLLTLNACLHVATALALYVLSLIAYVKGFGDLYTAALVDPNAPEDATLSTWYGAIGFFSWLVSPLGLLLGLYVVDSVSRAVGAVSTGKAPGSVFLWLPCLVWRRLRRSWAESELTATYGPADLPTEVEVKGRGLLVRTSRPREEWHELLTFSFRDELYRLVWRGEGARPGGKRCFEYRMEPWSDANPVRRILLLDPGPSGS